MEHTDDELIAGYLAGNENYFEQLVARHLQSVYNFTLRFVGAGDADDVTQEAFLKAWKSIRKFRRGQSFKTWIFTIARNTALDALRKKKHRPFSDFDRDDGSNAIADSLADTEPLADEVFGRLTDAKVLDAALAKLSPDAREVLLLRYREELTFDEIGKVMHQPLNTVKSRHRRALAALRDILAPKGPSATYSEYEQ